MLTRPLHPSHKAPEIREIRISRDGPGQNTWRWSVWQGSILVTRSPAGFAGPKAAYEVDRRVLIR